MYVTVIFPEAVISDVLREVDVELTLDVSDVVKEFVLLPSPYDVVVVVPDVVVDPLLVVLPVLDVDVLDDPVELVVVVSVADVPSVTVVLVSLEYVSAVVVVPDWLVVVSPVVTVSNVDVSDVVVEDSLESVLDVVAVVENCVESVKVVASVSDVARVEEYDSVVVPNEDVSDVDEPLVVSEVV